MKTEEIQRTAAAHDPHAVSRALQDLTPVSCAIVDRRGKPAPLSAAGYVLRYGHSYHLHLRSPFPDADLQEVRIVAPPSFVTVGPELRKVDEQGRTVHSLPFQVSLDWWSLWSHLRRFGIGINADELEVVHQFKPGLFREEQSFLCPIVARPRWTVLITFVFIGLVLVLLHNVIDRSLAFENPESMQLLWTSLTRWEPWLWLGGITLLLWCGVTLLNLSLLYQRSRECEPPFPGNVPWLKDTGRMPQPPTNATW